MQKLLHSVICADNQHQIGCLPTSLKTEAATCQLEEGWRTPALFGAAGRHAFTVIRTKDEARLHRGWDDGDAFRSRHNTVGNGPVGGGHDLAEYGAGALKPVHVGVPTLGC